jgi:hypothetical protein
MIMYIIVKIIVFLYYSSHDYSLNWYVRECGILLIKKYWSIIKTLNCENGLLGTDVDFVDNLW